MRRAISLLEVLICTFVLSLGLLGLGMLIPLGSLAVKRAAVADHCGACGRAALRDIKIRGMLDSELWVYADGSDARTVGTERTASGALDDRFSRPFVIDPLFIATNTPAIAGLSQEEQTFPFYSSASAIPAPQFRMPRITLRSIGVALPIMPQSLAERIFRWQDDLAFDTPEDKGRRPVPQLESKTYRIAPVGNYTWFITVSPPQYTVSAVVCYKRDLTFNATIGTGIGEHTAIVTFVGSGQGGGSIEISADSWNVPPGAPETIRDNQWIMLQYEDSDTDGDGIRDNPGRACWYRVLSIGENTADNAISLTLAGPDWDSSKLTRAVIVDGVVGVYTSAMEH